jgi:hypothetical protein
LRQYDFPKGRSMRRNNIGTVIPVAVYVARIIVSVA